MSFLDMFQHEHQCVLTGFLPWFAFFPYAKNRGWHGLAEDGQPLGGAWAQVVLECDGKMLSLDAAAQVFAQDVALSDFGGVVFGYMFRSDVDVCMCESLAA